MKFWMKFMEQLAQEKNLSFFMHQAGRKLTNLKLRNFCKLALSFDFWNIWKIVFLIFILFLLQL